MTLVLKRTFQPTVYFDEIYPLESSDSYVLCAGDPFVGSVSSYLFTAQDAHVKQLNYFPNLKLLCLGEDDFLYFTDSAFSSLTKSSVSGEAHWTIPWETKSLFVSSSGLLYTWSFDRPNIECFNHDGHLIWIRENPVVAYGLISDAHGNIFLSDTNFHNVVILHGSGLQDVVEPWDQVSDPSEPRVLFSYPGRLYFDQKHHLWVYNSMHNSNDITIVDLENKRYSKINMDEFGVEGLKNYNVHPHQHENLVSIVNSNTRSILKYEIMIEAWSKIPLT